MSTNYTMKIYRNCDDKEIYRVTCNWIKSLIDDGFIDRYDVTTIKYTISNLRYMSTNIKNKIDLEYDKIFNKKLMIPMCVNVSVKKDIEDDIEYCKGNIEDYLECLNAVHNIIGGIYALVEDNILINSNENTDIEDEVAYRYNAKDINKELNISNVFVDDVYFKFEC